MAVQAFDLNSIASMPIQVGDEEGERKLEELYKEQGRDAKSEGVNDVMRV